MKKAIYSLVLSLALLGFTSPASALLTDLTDWSLYPVAAGAEAAYVGVGGYVNTGNLLGVFDGNDSNQLDDLETWLAGHYGGSFELVQFSKFDVDENVYTSPDFNVTVAANQLSGTWSTTGALLSLYTVKAGNAFALYEVDPAAMAGQWSTFDLWLHGFGGNGGVEISHIAGFNPTAAPVPEPATMLLLGTGLVGLAGASRKKIFKK